MAIVGGGFGGVGAAVLLVRAGYRDVTIFERGERVGGVWDHNTYPGAACDVPSHLYEFSFEPNPRWSRRYAQQAEIQEYIEDVARRHGVLERARTGTEVTARNGMTSARTGSWTTSTGSFEADILITACGQLSIPKTPAIKGLESFAGPVFHTAEWRPRRRPRRQARRRHRDRMQRDSDGPCDPAGSRAHRRLPAFAGLDDAEDGLRILRAAKRLFERFPVLQRLDRMATFAFMDIGAAGMTSQRWLLAPFRAAGRSQIKKAIKDSDLRSQSDPGRRDRLQADHAHRRVVPDPRKAQRRADHRSNRPDHSHRHQVSRTAPSGRRRDHSRDRLREPRVRSADGGRRRQRAHPRRGVGPRRPRVPRSERIGLPEHVPSLRAEHERWYRFGHLRHRGRGWRT